jgi:hypothetical protein
MQRLSLLLAAIVLCAILLVAGCGDNKQPGPAASAPPPAVAVVKVTAACGVPFDQGRFQASRDGDIDHRQIRLREEKFESSTPRMISRMGRSGCLTNSYL